MDRLFTIVTGIVVIGGIVFFTSLFVAPLALSIKILAGIVLMFVTCAVFVLMAVLESVEDIRAQTKGPHLANSVQDAQTVTRSLLRRISQREALRGPTRWGRLGPLLLGIFALWMLTGYLFRTFFQS